MSALDFGARALARQARRLARGVAAQAASPAYAALAQGQVRPVDLVCIGDSVQLFGGYGWDAALNRAFAADARFGVWATALYPQETSGTAYSNQGWLNGAVVGAAGASSGAEAAFDDRRLPDASYFYTAAGAMGTGNGLSIGSGGEIDVNANLRYHVYYGTFDSGAGLFKLGARMGVSPFSNLNIDGAQINTNTGAKGEAETAIDLPAAARNYTLEFKLQRNGGTASVGPTIVFAQRLQNLGKANGVSVHSFYARGGESLYDMAASVQALSVGRRMWGFGKLRKAQLDRGHKPIVVVRICSGFNDLNETGAPTKGPAAFASASNKALAYADNLAGLIKSIEDGWAAQGWPLDELFFHVLASYPNASPDPLAALRSGARMLARSRSRTSFTDLALLVPYADTAAAAGLTDGTHPTSGWADEMARRELALIPTIEVVA